MNRVAPPLALAVLLGSCGLGTPAPTETTKPRSAPLASSGLSSEPALPVVPPTAPIDFARAGCASPGGLEYFFPTSRLFQVRDPASADLLVRTWYSRVLSAAREPTLSCAAFAPQRYRFLRIPTWAPPSYVRVELSARSAEVWRGVLSGSGGYDPGEPQRTSQRKLSESERRQLSGAITHSALWQIPTDDSAHDGFDGTQWILEARAGASYHVVHRWAREQDGREAPAADADGAFSALCRRFMELGDG
jgi:hypothetical protein